MFARLFRHLPAVLIISASLSLGGCGYNDFQRLDEETRSAWAEVLNQYQRRADLIPNLVATVKGEASFEQETLTRVIEARSRATAIQVSPEMLNDPQAMERFQQAQGQLGGALSRLLAVAENYPDLKTNQGFQDLRVQLEGTENRVTVARNMYCCRAAVQRAGAQLSDQPDGHGLQLPGQAQLHGGQRGGHQCAAGGQLRQARQQVTRPAAP